MAFDVYFQRFRDGDSDEGGGDAMRLALAQYVVREDPDSNFASIKYGNGTADLYLEAGGMLANHVSGDQPWDLLVDGARAAQWVILPAGYPTCVTDEAQRAHLPEGLDDQVVLVRTGAELLAVIRSA